MDRYLWNFDTISAIQEVDFHKTLSDFYTRGIDGVVFGIVFQQIGIDFRCTLL